MENILNITNGDITVNIMKEAKISGDFLPWRDILYDGPVPKEISLEELSLIRADFIISRNWGTTKDIKQSFIERDNLLKSFEEYSKIILWFEHDLYDQLQILQILDWFYNNKRKINLSIICTNQYLGMLSPTEMKELQKYEEIVTKKNLLLANKAWNSFREDSPEKWNNLLDEDTSVLPFLKEAILRILEEYPNCNNGLSRTANQALKIISEGESIVTKVFNLNQKREERVFLGDLSFWIIIQEFLDSTPPLLKLSKGGKLIPANKTQKLTITSVGLEVLSGKRDWLEIKNENRWIGGVHLKKDNIWYWNPKSKQIISLDKKMLTVS